MVDYHYPVLTAGQWQNGLCENCFTPHRDLVMLCTHCRKGCCDDSVCDPCVNCGLPFCNTCSRAHDPCHSDVLVKYRPELECRHCKRPHAIGTGISCNRCIRCLKPCCIARQHCQSQIHTAQCGCHGDMCGDCAYWRDLPRSNCVYIFDTDALVRGFMLVAVVPRLGPRRYVCRRCFPTAIGAQLGGSGELRQH